MITHTQVIAETAARHGLTAEIIRARLGRAEAQRHKLARNEAMWRLYQLRDRAGRRRFSTTRIGQLFGNRDHTTALHAIREFEKIIALVHLLPEWEAANRADNLARAA